MMLPFIALAGLLLGSLSAQQPAPASRQAIAEQANAQAAKVSHAEHLLEQGNWKEAEAELADLAKADPKDARIVFDLGFTQEHNGEDQAAKATYATAVADDPTLAEPHVALGLLEARAGDAEGARQQLRAAVGIASAPPALRARAYRALARLDQGGNADQARIDLRQAVELTGEQPGDAELTASLSAAAGHPGDAEAAYRSALASNPGDVEAATGLGSLLQRQGKLAEADEVMSPLLAKHAADPRLVAQMATLDAAENKNADALHLLEALRSSDRGAADNSSLTRLYAHLLLLSGDPARAEALYRSLSGASPHDPTLLDELGSTLVREQHFPEAQEVFSRAVAARSQFHDDTAWAETAGHLAFAASRNHKPEVVLQALNARATVLPNSPATLFLGATAHDSLHQKKEAERDYRAFLAMSNGKLPDEEFEVRHRLVALEHER